MDKKYYIAYGSNLNTEQMKYRCPTAVLVGTGALEDYQLMFSLFASVVPREGSSVPVALWEIDDLCERRLDAYEDYPALYRKESVTALIGGTPREGLMYIINRSSYQLPDDDYLGSIRQGYIDLGLDTAALDRAVEYTKMNINI